MAVTLDLRNYGVTRSDAPAEDLPPLLLPRAKVNLTLLLPTGSEPGEYDVRLVGLDDEALASGLGRTGIRDFVATLTVTVDLTKSVRGPGRLVVRRQGEGVQSFPVTLK
jgi:hypothetical protein